MKAKNYILFSIALILSLSMFSQQGKQKKADTLFNKFSFVKASEVYKELVDKNFNKDYVTRQLADCYSLMRDPRNASRYYKRAVEQENVPTEYYYKYAQSLRGVKKYDESKIWLERYKDSGGVVNSNDFSKDIDAIISGLGPEQQYYLEDVYFNSKYSDFGAFEHNGKIYFTSSRDEGVSIERLYGWNEEPFLDIYVTEVGEGIDTDTITVDHSAKIKGDVNSIYHDGPVVITKDGKTMYFSRNNYIKDEKTKKKELTNVKIFRATRVGQEWKNIEDLSINGDGFSTQHPALNKDETKLYFSSDREGTYGGSDIWMVDINDDGTLSSDIQNLGNIVNTESAEGFPFINNEDVLFFSSDGHTGLGLLDIFATIKEDGEEGLEEAESKKNVEIIGVINLGKPINSNKDDFSFFMNDDGISGYLASNRASGKGSDDIYTFKRDPSLQVEGLVTDAINGNPIPNAKITLYDDDDNEIAYMETNEEGYYEINIDRNKDYKIVATQNKYIDDYREFTSKDIQTELSTITANLLLNPIQDVIKLADLNLNTIYFDYDKYAIRPDATNELNKIVNLMQNEYPDMIIRIESHTDSRGEKNYNDKLSGNRAKATYEYLIANGISPDRIPAYEGFGEQKLTNKCKDGVKCKEDEHQLNRRTQFIVVTME